MLELYQTEWCPASHRVRQRLTEFGLDYLVHQTPVDPAQRLDVEAVTGQTAIPTLVDGTCVLVGEKAIIDYLDSRYAEPAGARLHPRKGFEGEKARPGGSMQTVRSNYTLSKTTNLAFDHAVERVRTELRAEGFGILCEIDVHQTLRDKLGIEREPYLILGACNPTLAHGALEAEPELGVLLPCNVVVYTHDDQTRIAAVDPERMLSIVANDDLAPAAAEVRRRLEEVVTRV